MMGSWKAPELRAPSWARSPGGSDDAPPPEKRASAAKPSCLDSATPSSMATRDTTIVPSNGSEAGSRSLASNFGERASLSTEHQPVASRIVCPCASSSASRALQTTRLSGSHRAASRTSSLGVPGAPASADLPSEFSQAASGTPRLSAGSVAAGDTGAGSIAWRSTASCSTWTGAGMPRRSWTCNSPKASICPGGASKGADWSCTGGGSILTVWDPRRTTIVSAPSAPPSRRFIKPHATTDGPGGPAARISAGLAGVGGSYPMARALATSNTSARSRHAPASTAGGLSVTPPTQSTVQLPLASSCPAPEVRLPGSRCRCDTAVKWTCSGLTPFSRMLAMKLTGSSGRQSRSRCGRTSMPRSSSYFSSASATTGKLSAVPGRPPSWPLVVAAASMPCCSSSAVEKEAPLAPDACVVGRRAEDRRPSASSMALAAARSPSGRDWDLTPSSSLAWPWAGTYAAAVASGSTAKARSLSMSAVRTTRKKSDIGSRGVRSGTGVLALMGGRYSGARQKPALSARLGSKSGTDVQPTDAVLGGAPGPPAGAMTCCTSTTSCRS
mmetsp:Transcript_26949/g.89699  ORF Transcript_26949/g.89699 Transcript_26949/m.89699 type:complete len:556 (+) Transcript_26949:812-2479(+)